MYVPYLRGKQNEQFAVLEIDQSLFDENKILPIFEPTDCGKNTMNRYIKMCNSGRPFVLIVNPAIPGGPGINDVINKIVKGKLSPFDNYLLGLIVTDESTLSAIKAFINMFPKIQKVLIHCKEFSDPTKLATLNEKVAYHVFASARVSATYIKTAGHGGSKIILDDGFVLQDKNANYGGTEHFSDRHLTWGTEGFDGFGDYLIVGDNFRPPAPISARAVALHLSHEGKKDSIYVSHFVSNDVTGIRDPGKKFLQALKKLITFADANSVLETSGMIDFRDLHARKHYPGLGGAKKHSMKHHMELMVEYGT